MACVAPTIDNVQTSFIAPVSHLFSLQLELSGTEPINVVASLPSWLTLNSTTRVISGTPTIDQSGTTVQFFVRAANSCGLVSKLFTVTIPEAVAGPVRWSEGDSYSPGTQEGESYLPGFQEGDATTEIEME